MDESATGRHAHGHGHGHGHGHEPRRTGLLARVRHAVVPHAHDAVDAINTAECSARDGIRTAWIGLAGMTATAIAQVVIVAASGSIALLADTLHNLGHAVTTIPLIMAFQLGRRAATDRYPYGFRRAEELVGLLISLVILASIVLIVRESVDALIDPRPLTNPWWVFAAGVVGALGNEIVAIHRIRTGRRIGSAALIAEGQHARADGLTSVAVVVGVVGVWLGVERADAIVGLLIAAVITGILINSGVIIVRRLLDGVEPGAVARMRAVIAGVDGVREVGLVRARWVGHRMEGDAEIGVDADLSLREGHDVAEHVEHELMHAIGNLDRMQVHLHPTVGGAVPGDLHELSGHHASEAARAAYRERTARTGS
ncbi:cation diffusion facilitator family transporter [Actinomycetospora lutea]|uniref:cation diffusion facilitator family transporter n=1 Tax=Actinomycetospora lutea TaxID=663604 RepID=UPI002366632C|nr:cation diffusion facilitator family transporter [Actinomycetospora lutea]MDD7941025.1 cation diffusion facilitator family transporter [Actinomycetospora lutea]